MVVVHPSQVIKKRARTRRASSWRPVPEKYRGWTMACPSGRPMKCRARGCDRELRKYQADIVCSEACRIQLRAECHTFLAILEGRMDARDLPVRLRTKQKRKITGGNVRTAKHRPDYEAR